MKIGEQNSYVQISFKVGNMFNSFLIFRLITNSKAKTDQLKDVRHNFVLVERGD